MQENSHSVIDRIQLLRESEARFLELTRFNKSRPGSWTDQDLAEHRRLRAAWTKAVDQLYSFDHPGKRPFV